MGTPKGQRLAVAFFCFLFLAKQEKGVAAGPLPATNHGEQTQQKPISPNKPAPSYFAQSPGEAGLSEPGRATNFQSA